MKVLIACEESQTVCKAFRERGHEAYSCDIQPCMIFEHIEWHIMDDALQVINGNCSFQTMDGRIHTQRGQWDLVNADTCYMQKSNPEPRYFSAFVADHLLANGVRLPVTCGECKHADEKAYFCNIGRGNSSWGMCTYPEGYCDSGERRADNESYDM